MKKTRITPAALRAWLEGDIDNTMTPSGIEAQEKQGQLSMVASAMFPINIKGKSIKELEKIGFVFGDPVDDLFQSCQLPQGWRIEPTDHSMWSNIVDGDGAVRGMIFYKAAFYDRDAFATFN